MSTHASHMQDHRDEIVSAGCYLVGAFEDALDLQNGSPVTALAMTRLKDAVNAYLDHAAQDRRAHRL